MSAEQDFHYPEVETYDKDGRRPLDKLYNEAYASLLKRGWKVDPITIQEGELENGRKVFLPICAFLSPKKTQGPEPTFWMIGGIHGEESATPNAFGQEIETIAGLPDIGIPVVAIFVANPLGYIKDWRFPTIKRGADMGQSVGDSDHLLPRRILKNIPRRPKPGNPTADIFTKWVLKIAQLYEPFLVVNHHEDELEKNPTHPSRPTLSYSYAYGNKKILGTICPSLAETLSKSGYQVQKRGLTRFFEPIKDSFAINARDGSVDELLASPIYIDNFNIRRKKPAKVVLVLETIIPYDLSERLQTMNHRVSIHGEIIRSYPYLWGVVKEDETS